MDTLHSRGPLGRILHKNFPTNTAALLGGKGGGGKGGAPLEEAAACRAKVRVSSG